MAKKTIVVIGLGTMGSMSLWQLSKLAQRFDLEVIGVEQFGLSHSYGAFTGESRLFRTAYHEGEKYVPLLKEARSLWKELGAEAGRELLLDFGCLNVGRSTDAPFVRLRESIEKHGLPYEELDAQALRDRYPGLDFQDNESGIVDLLGGAMRPELAVYSAVEQAKLNGAKVLEHTEITAVTQLEGGGVEIVAGDQTIVADCAVVTSGAWSKLVLPQLAPLIEVRKLVLTWFLPKIAGEFDPQNLPTFIRDRGDFHLFGAPCVDGYSVKISGLDLWGGPETDRIEDCDLRLDRQALSEFGQQVTELFPGVHPEPNRYSVHFDTYTADKTPIMDRVGDVVVATGFSGHGFKMAPAVGKLCAELATQAHTELMHPSFAIQAHEPVHAAV
ncbi:N-methyl-L-tryptophan oxidase [Corynebacterium sp. 153RC1]|uniref:N-methyl-L-tryptophan oxidase n=1 Tax=unclassified Corynebacterium TaxID=2624378 RepID=UPI00211CE63F|nr:MULTISPECIES: N-methyl-L-tryptophan oxidase [unclassified Corynebacterium]MCQ9371695.1 N-methyl-L-tryptophan oxidase [Corynebacterium sp. 35RC1]MCQ9353091.1 N-methyl-L-tryptophan oxidase [Corynebacterium sp. 209RC1]MCQ9355295.1 N-methyl-L-tryptophan oxidase [Corynebacterium sp. 1222RC1]MCQ9357582.1 N-methyl-L-tryptophan oxidase [Corynebacterium sp. 122RC1]MCQ9359192.1 N-methyl-L-tryptophan oxidase [Corynebacterium sp. 142RC1]